MLTADTYTSLLPGVARKAAEDVATLIIAAGCLVPGTTRPRQPEPADRGGGAGSGSRAHPGRQACGDRQCSLWIMNSNYSLIVANSSDGDTLWVTTT